MHRRCCWHQALREAAGRGDSSVASSEAASWDAAWELRSCTSCAWHVLTGKKLELWNCSDCSLFFSGDVCPTFSTGSWANYAISSSLQGDRGNSRPASAPARRRWRWIPVGLPTSLPSKMESEDKRSDSQSRDWKRDEERVCDNNFAYGWKRMRLCASAKLTRWSKLALNTAAAVNLGPVLLAISSCYHMIL